MIVSFPQEADAHDQYLSSQQLLLDANLKNTLILLCMLV